MSNHDLSTGIPATHIGPETGSTGAATSGEESGSGTKSQTAPAAASGLDNVIPSPGADENRSFEPANARRAARASGGPVDTAAQDLRDLADGKDRPQHEHGRDKHGH
jgi:hypothetical protein